MEIGVNKIFPSAAEALKGIVADGQLIGVGGFGLCGIPEALIDAYRPTRVTAAGANVRDVEAAARALNLTWTQ